MQIILLVFFAIYPEIMYLAAAQEKDANGTDDSDLKRYVMEYDFKPAIFGSFNYDPVKQEFDTPKNMSNSQKSILRKSAKITSAAERGITRQRVQDHAEPSSTTVISQEQTTGLRNASPMSMRYRATSDQPTRAVIQNRITNKAMASKSSTANYQNSNTGPGTLTNSIVTSTSRSAARPLIKTLKRHFAQKKGMKRLGPRHFTNTNTV